MTKITITVLLYLFCDVFFSSISHNVIFLVTLFTNYRPNTLEPIKVCLGFELFTKIFELRNNLFESTRSPRE